ncbi:MAG: FixH family protein [Pseudomonadota bacterium]
MNTGSGPEGSQFRRNPVFWIMCALPAAAVLAGLSTLAIALRSGDGALPAAYHWEGARLDADFVRARTAAAAGIEMTFEARPASHHCVATVRNAPGNTAALYLQFTHGRNADLDRTLRLQRIGVGRYAGDCAAIPAGRWRIAVEDDAHGWSLHGLAEGPLRQFTLRAQDPDGRTR